jgi:hypothetical protein
MKKNYIFPLIFLFGQLGLLAQYSPKTDGSANSLLLSETRIERPLQMHRNQLQLNPGYGFYVTLGAFDASGNKINYKDQGLTSSSNVFNLNARYGIAEYLEFFAGISYNSTLRRMNDLLVFGNEYTEVTSITELKGMDDLRLGFSLRPVNGISTIDLAFRVGASVPAASSDKKRPTNTVTQQTGYTIINYHNFNSYGKGMTFLQFGLDAKFRFSSAALTMFADASRGLGESTYTDWKALLSGNEFVYSRTDLPMRYPDMYTISAMIDMKVFDWFDVYAGYRYQIANNGWQEISGLKYALPETVASSLILGVEILTTTHLRILENAELSVAGKNSNAQTGIYTSFSYNLFTSK